MINRAEPAMPMGAYQTYAIDSPPDVMVKAACERVDCAAWRHGWESPVDESTDLGARQASYIRRHCGRTFTEHRTGEGLTVFRFPPGQRCFAEHRTRPESYSVLAGDWRGYGGVIRAHSRPADWVDDFATHQDRLATRLGQG